MVFSPRTDFPTNSAFLSPWFGFSFPRVLLLTPTEDTGSFREPSLEMKEMVDFSRFRCPSFRLACLPPSFFSLGHFLHQLIRPDWLVSTDFIGLAVDQAARGPPTDCPAVLQPRDLPGRNADHGHSGSSLYNWAQWIITHGTFKQNVDYVIGPFVGVNGRVKDFNPQHTSKGEPPRPCTRTDLEDYLSAIKEGASDRELYEEFPLAMLRFPKAKEHLRAAMLEPHSGARENVACVVMWGDTGEGKSWIAHCGVGQHTPIYSVARGDGKSGVSP